MNAPIKSGIAGAVEDPLKALTWFDRFYFSGLTIPSETAFSNDLSRLNPLWEAYPSRQDLSRLLEDHNPASPLLATRLLARQQFNIHSTSVAAWTADSTD